MANSRNLPRWLKITLSAAVVLLLVFHVGGGYLFSNMIETDALAPQPPTPDYGVYVVALDEDLITISSAEERSDTVHPGVLGLAWDDGYGQIGEIHTVDGLDVTRDFNLVSGTNPQVCSGVIETCQPVDIEGWAFETDPGDVGLVFEEVSFKAPLGPLGAWLIEAGDGTTWAVHAHGWRASRREAIRSLPAFSEAGVTSLVVDYRNDPSAPADPSGLYRFGRTEWEDMEAAVEYALANGAEEVVLVGYSTGAAAHAAFMGDSDLAKHVKALVFDAPNLNMGAVIEKAASEMTLPGTPIPVPASLTWVAMVMADLRFDVDWKDINYVTRANQLLTKPTLVFHGTEDGRVPISVSRSIAEVASQVTLVETEGADHVTSWNVDPNAYSEALRRFLGEVAVSS